MSGHYLDLKEFKVSRLCLCSTEIHYRTSLYATALAIQGTNKAKSRTRRSNQKSGISAAQYSAISFGENIFVRLLRLSTTNIRICFYFGSQPQDIFLSINP